MVQKVYSADTDSEVQDLQEAEVKFGIDQKKAKQKSKGYQIRASRVEKTLHGWLDNDSDNTKMIKDKVKDLGYTGSMQEQMTDNF